MNDHVLERLRSDGPAALGDTQVLFAYLFGSQVTGGTHPGSDIDVGVLLDSSEQTDPLDLTLDLIGRLANSTGLGRIEITILNSAPLRLVGRALTDGALFYSRDEKHRVSWESRTFREYWDFRVSADAADRRVLRDMAEGTR